MHALHHAARQRPLPAAVELVGVRLPRRCASCSTRRTTRASRPRRSSGAPTSGVLTDRGELRAPLVVDALGWRRVLGDPHYQPPEAPLSRGLEVHPPHDAQRRRAALLDRARPRAPRLRLARPGGRRGARSASARTTRASTSRSRRSRWPSARRRGRALPGQLVPAPPAPGRRRRARSSPATAPATASRSAARGSAPRSTSASPPGARSPPSSRARNPGTRRCGLRALQRAAPPRLRPRAAAPAARPGAPAARADGRAQGLPPLRRPRVLLVSGPGPAGGSSVARCCCARCLSPCCSR